MLAIYGIYALFGLAAWIWAQLGQSKRLPAKVQTAGWIILAVAALAWLWTVSEPRIVLSDFKKAYLPAARHVLHDPAALYPGVSPTFTNLPIIAYLFTPFTLLPPRFAGWVMIAGGFVCLAVIPWVLARLFASDAQGRLMIAALCVMSGPLMNSIREGNTTHWVFLLILFAWRGFASRRDVLAGVCLAIAGLIKLPLLLFGVWLFARKRWQAVAAFSGTVVLTSAASVALFGFELNRIWYERCIAPFSRQPLAAFNVQSIDGMLARILVPGDHLMQWEAIVEPGQVFLTAKFLVTLLVVACVIVTCVLAGAPKSERDWKLEFGITLCLALLLSPLSWSHYYLLLLFPLSWGLAGSLRQEDKITPGWLWGITAVLLALPVLRVGPVEPPLLREIIAHLAISHYAIGGLMLLGILLAQRRYLRTRAR